MCTGSRLTLRCTRMRGSGLSLAIAVIAIMSAADRVDGQELLPEDAQITEASRTVADDPSFGPMLVIEAIEVQGNASTAERLIRRALPIAAGDALRAGDPRLRKARYKVLALGFFRSVDLELRKGSERGKVILTVIVAERGTIVLNSLHFGNSTMTPWWAGADLTERNLLGSGIGVGGGFVYAAESDIAGADSQWAMSLRAEDWSILGSPFGAHGSFLYADASEPYRVGGADDDASNDNFRAFGYRRAGLRGGVGFNVTPLSRMSFDGRAEWIDSDAPLAPTRDLTDGTVVPVDLGLRPGNSRVASLSVGFERDTRADPVLPYNGDRLVLIGELAATWLGGSYTYGTALASYQHWWPVRSLDHVISIHLIGGVQLGDAPRFDRFHVSDFNRMVAPRVNDMVVSTTPSFDLLGTSTAALDYGEVGASAIVEYSYRLFRSRRHVYGGDLFVGAGLWGLAAQGDLQLRDSSLYRAMPIDLVIDAGLRIDTEIGIFELTFANALGRLPL